MAVDANGNYIWGSGSQQNVFGLNGSSTGLPTQAAAPTAPISASSLATPAITSSAINNAATGYQGSYTGGQYNQPFSTADAIQRGGGNTNSTDSSSKGDGKGTAYTNADGSINGMGIGSLVLGGANALLGYKNYGLAKDTFEHNKQMALANYAANRIQANNLINTSNNINAGVTSKANSLATQAGNPTQTYQKKSLVKAL